MSALLTIALCLAPQVATPLAPSAPAAGHLAFTYGRVYGLNLTNGSFHEFEIPTQDGLERFGLYVPFAPTGELLVHFHGFNGGHQELLHQEYALGMLQEADARSWFLVAPDQRVRNAQGQFNGITYGSDEAQRRVQAVLDWVLAELPVDRNRIYGYGFSMGGGDCLSYAAQHLDPTRGAFAALINHTGTLVLTEEWTLNHSARFWLEGVFSGDPSVAGYAYRRASTIEYTWNALLPGTFVMGGRHAASNLEFTPTRSWFHVGDTILPHARQFMTYVDQLLIDHEIIEQPTQSGLWAHDWRYLDPVVACAWFAQKALVVPTAGKLHFSRNARYHDLELTRKIDSDFGTLEFDVPLNGDTVEITAPYNVRKVRIDALRSGLDTSGSLFVNVGRDTHQHPAIVGRPVIIEVVNLGFVPTVVQSNAPRTEQPHVAPGNGVVTFVSRANGTTIDEFELSR